MKILLLIIPVILSFHGNVYAATLKDVCNWAEDMTVSTYDSAEMYKEFLHQEDLKEKPNKKNQEKFLKAWESFENDIAKWAKVYHYLDCSRFD